MKFTQVGIKSAIFFPNRYMICKYFYMVLLKLKIRCKFFQEFLSNFMNYSIVCLLCILSTFCSLNSNGQATDQEIISKADTSLFSPNVKSGWSTMMSFFKASGLDSVRFEVVLFINREIDLTRRQVVGRIKTSHYVPTNNKMLETSFGHNKVEVNIDINGYVWLKLLSGPLLNEQRKVIPLVLFYKK